MVLHTHCSIYAHIVSNKCSKLYYSCAGLYHTAHLKNYTSIRSHGTKPEPDQTSVLQEMKRTMQQEKIKLLNKNKNGRMITIKQSI